MGKFIDLSGQKFHDLQIIKRAENKCRRTRWTCLCSCGNTIDAFANALRNGTTKNCGDTKKHKSNRGGAQYILHGLADTAKYKMYMAAKFRAKQQSIPFTLTLSEMPDIPERCPVFGFKLEHRNGHGTFDRSPSLDKIIPEKGYVSGNVQIISGKANKMKSNATVEEVGRLYQYLLEMSHKPYTNQV